jgi:FlaA1/EpsC-like NDP-sugar epimerase
LEALKTNTLGTWNVKRAAIHNRIEKSLLISTDKAVEPVNLYGMTKAIAEKIWVNNEFVSEPKFAVVRYGNVIGSRGSVIPYFKHLIKEKETLPITHPDMTRFLLTLGQATNLVFYATENMKGGEIYVPKIPACSIIDLVKVMAEGDYPIKITGIRPGEKIHECLIQEDEFRRTEDRENCYIIHNYDEYSSGMVHKEFTSENARRLSPREIAHLLKESGGPEEISELEVA